MSENPATTQAAERPLVTFALFAYNQEKYIREAIEGAFAQTYEPLEIILSDDCSADQTFEIMKEMAASYSGPHKVSARRNPANLGPLSHILCVAGAANGEILVVAAGDDIAFPNRVEIVKSQFSDESVYAVSTDDIIIDEHGVEQLWDSGRITLRDGLHRRYRTWLHGATAAYRVEFLRSFPTPQEKVYYEDMVFSDAILLIGKRTIRLKSPTIKYRYHSSNLSNRGPKPAGIAQAEAVAIERWGRARGAKKFCVNFATVRLAKEEIIYQPALNAILGEEKYLSLISNWKDNNVSKNIALLYFGLRYGSFRASVARAFGERFFLFAKKLMSR